MVGEFTGIANWLKVQVVYKACFADKHSEQDVARPGNAGYRLESVGVDDFRVVHRGEGLGFEALAQDALQAQGIARAGGEFGLGGCKRAMQNGSGAALSGAEIGIARRKGQ